MKKQIRGFSAPKKLHIPDQQRNQDNNYTKSIFKRSSAFIVFDSQFQAELYNSRCFDTGQKIDDVQKAKIFKDDLNKINSKKNAEVLNLYSLRLGVNSVATISSYVLNNKFSTINLADNSISEYGMHSIKTILTSPHLKHLNLSSNMISQAGLQTVLDQLSKNVSLLTLDLGVLQGSIRKNSFGAQGAKYIAAILLSNKTIQSLKLQDNDLGINGAEFISKALKQSKALKHLKLAQNQIKTKGTIQILKAGHYLVSLDISKNYIKSSIGPHLQSYVQINTNLRRLNLQYNELLLQGFRYLVQGLAHSSVQYLNVRGNAIRNQGVILLSQYLAKSQFKCRNFLQQLDISLNQVSLKGVSALAEILPETKIRSLNISKNILEQQGLQIIINQMQPFSQTSHLSRLDISSCRIGDQSLLKFIQKIKRFPNFKYIRCSDNYISQKYQKLLVQLTSKNYNLLQFQLNGNRLSLSCLARIKRIMERNQKKQQTIEPNKIKRQIYRMRYQQKKVAEAAQQLQQESRQINALKDQKAKLLLQISKMERQEARKKQQLQHKVAKTREDILRKKGQLAEKLQQLRKERQQKSNQLDRLKKQFQQIKAKRQKQ